MSLYDIRLIRYPKGSVWKCNLSQVIKLTGVQTKDRPVVIISSNIGNITNSSVIVALITSNSEKGKHSINVPFINNDGDYNVVLCNQLHTVSKQTLSYQTGILPDGVIYEIEKAINLSLGIQLKEATIAELELIANRIVEAYNSNKEYTERYEGIKQDKIDEIVTKLEGLMGEEGDKQRGKEQEILEDKQRGNIKKDRGYWTTERKKEYIRDKEAMSLEGLADKWGMNSTKTAYQMYHNFKKQLTK